MKVLVVGSGTWGTALAHVAQNAGMDVTVHCRRQERAAELASGRHSFLPELSLGAGFKVCVAGVDPVPASDVVISAIPTQMIRSYLQGPGADLPRDVPWISASKGLEKSHQALPSQILKDCGVVGEPGILSGPSHAEEVLRNLPTAVVFAHPNEDFTVEIQKSLRTPEFRIYRSLDRIGVEWAGVLKNVVALGCGIAVGHGFGDNTIAAMVTRGSTEISRMGCLLGGQRETFSGLSGIGDLVVTCFSSHSRNRVVGESVGQGQPVADVLSRMEQVAEGVHTCSAAAELARERSVEMPIVETVSKVMAGELSVEQGIEGLLLRVPDQE